MIIIKNNTYVIVKDYQELMRLKFNKPFEDKPSWKEVLKLSEELKVPLHPDYTFYWKLISGNAVFILREWLQKGKKWKYKRCGY